MGGFRQALAENPPPRGLSRSILSRTILGGTRCYQRFISPLLPRACRFYPSCSEYALTALRSHGLPHGAWLLLRRLGRCHPFHLRPPDPFDPVP